MSLGAGIVCATVLVLAAFAFWRITVNQKWKLVAKVALGIVAVAAVIGAGFWGWSKYQSRPHYITELAGIKLGMTPVEVTLALGEPREKSEPARNAKGKESFAYSYTQENSGDYLLFVLFDSDSGSIGVTLVCEQGGYSDLLGFSRYSKETDVIERLGTPGGTSIGKNGLEKMISYPRWRASYQIEKGKVTAVCTSSSGKVGFKEEYK